MQLFNQKNNMKVLIVSRQELSRINVVKPKLEIECVYSALYMLLQ